ncbi:MAG: hypothetical protein CMJ18_27490 [Phycisphaeraceae bacterium]|nr:hypothetical protein [Phycisphaeraceae bacterium]
MVREGLDTHRLGRRLLALGLLLALSGAAIADVRILRSESGARMKVIARRATAIHANPVKGGAARAKARMFDFYYVVDPGMDGDLTRNGYYRVAGGFGRDDILGWVRANDMILWPHRTALRLRNTSDRDRARIYATRRDLENAFASTNRPPAPSGLEPDRRGIEGMMPVLARFRLKISGVETAGYRVAYRQGSQARPTPVGRARSGLDVVFVVDTTNSMGPFIHVIRRAVARVADLVSAETPVRFGLVAYRDVIADPGPDWYVRRMVCDLRTGADHRAFLRRLATVRAALCDSEDAAEEVLGGLQLAVDEAGWDPSAAKHIVLVGDASAQTTRRGSKNPCRLGVQDVLTGAQPIDSPQRQIAVHAVRVISAHPEDHVRCEQHFRELAAGTSISGRYLEFDVRFGASSLTNRMSAMILGFHRDALRQSRSAASEQTRPILGPRLLAVAPPGAAVKPDGFARGFICALDARGRPVVDRVVMVTYGELDQFDSTLDFIVKTIRAGGDPGARDQEQVLRRLENFVSGASLGGDLADVPVRALLLATCDVPATGAPFAHRISDLIAMPRPAFEHWARDIAASRARARRHLARSDLWFTPGSSAGTLAGRHAFLKADEMP